MIRQGAGEAIPVPGSGYSHERNVPPNGSDADQLIGLAIQALQAAEQRIKQFDNAGPAPEPRAQIRLNCAGRAAICSSGAGSRIPRNAAWGSG